MAYNWDELGFKRSYYKYRYDPIYPSGWIRCPKNEMVYCKCQNPPTRPEHSHSDHHHDDYVDDRYNLTYCRDFFNDYPLFKNRATNIVTGLNIPEGSTILVAGCAFGYLVEELNKLDMNAWGFDNSSYIQQNKRLESTISVHNIDLGSALFVDEIQTKIIINQFDYIITEDVLTSYSDDELTPLLNNCDNIATNVIHIVAQEAFPEFNIKPLSAWRALKPNHTWLDFNGSS